MVQLSDQQYQCVALVARGLQDKEIARELGIAYGTVKAYLESARNKTGTTNRVELAVLYMRGTIQAPESAR